MKLYTLRRGGLEHSQTLFCIEQHGGNVVYIADRLCEGYWANRTPARFVYSYLRCHFTLMGIGDQFNEVKIDRRNEYIWTQ